MNVRDLLLQQQLMAQAQAQGQGGMPLPTDNPAMMAAMQQQAIPQGPRDPLASGASAAINAVRQSPTREGFMSKLLNSAGRTLSHMGVSKLRSSYHPRLKEMGNLMMTVDEQEEVDRIRQMQLLQFLQKQEAAREMMSHRQAQLAEQRRYHDMRLAETRAKKRGRGGDDYERADNLGIDLSQYPRIKSAGERTKIAKKLDELHGSRELLLRAKSNLKKLKDTSGGMVDPTGSQVPILNSIGDAISRRGDSEYFDLRNNLNSDFSNFEIQYEKALKGGVPDAQTIKRLHAEKVYPGLGLPLHLNEQKVDTYLKEINRKIKAADLSLKTNHHINDVEEDEGVEEETTAAPVDVGAIVSKIRALDPRLEKFTDKQLLEWAKAKGAL